MRICWFFSERKVMKIQDENRHKKKKKIFKREKSTLFYVCWSVHQMLHMIHVDLDSWRRTQCMCCAPGYLEVFDIDKYFLPSPNLGLKKIAWGTQWFDMQKVKPCMFPELLRLPMQKCSTPALRRLLHVPKHL